MRKRKEGGRVRASVDVSTNALYKERACVLSQGAALSLELDLFVHVLGKELACLLEAKIEFDQA
jgi:hypothetical protein